MRQTTPTPWWVEISVATYDQGLTLRQAGDPGNRREPYALVHGRINDAEIPVAAYSGLHRSQNRRKMRLVAQVGMTAERCQEAAARVGSPEA